MGGDAGLVAGGGGEVRHVLVGGKGQLLLLLLLNCREILEHHLDPFFSPLDRSTNQLAAAEFLISWTHTHGSDLAGRRSDHVQPDLTAADACGGGTCRFAAVALPTPSRGGDASLLES